MLPKYHIIIGAITTTIIAFIFPLTYIQLITIFLSSFLIDVDHYLLYVFKTKDYSLKNSRKYFFKRRKRWIKLSNKEKKQYKRPIYIFHGIESWILLITLSLYTKLIWFVLIGFLIHIILDYIEIIYLKDSFYSKFSQLYVYLTNKKKI